jgi:GntR family transcriptional regulator
MIDQVHYSRNALSHIEAALFTLNPHSGVPIYRQLIDQVRRMVAGGQLPAGSELPSIRDLAVKHAVNPMTVSKAYTLLESEGLLVRHRGKPMTVAARSRVESLPVKRLQHLDTQMDQLVLAARQLGFSEPEVIQALRDRWENHDDWQLRRRAPAR